MTKNRNSQKANKRPSKMVEASRLQHRDAMLQLEIAKAQSTKFVPEVMDVPRIRFTPKQLFNVELSYQQTIVTSNATATLNALSFALSNAPGYSSYTNVFDQYRILQVNVKFMPFQTAAFNPVPGSGGYLYTVIDYDDANPPGSAAALLSYATLKITPGGVIDERTLAPKYATAAYSGAFTSYAQMPTKMWVDAASPSVQYFGIKYAIPQTPSAENILVIVTMALQFKSQRAS